MRRIVKPENSKAKHLIYNVGGNNTEIRDILLNEQKNICAYTETYLDVTSKKEIEHFNPILKNTDKDGYQNYFLVKGQWNNIKGGKTRWRKFQPVLHPTDDLFEERVVYMNGVFLWKTGDIEAKNLIQYLNLDNEKLTELRNRYIKRQRGYIEEYYEGDALSFFESLLKNQPEDVYFIRVIQEEFNIKLSLSENK